jgi:diaminohydroxyphosphoribosylaminopyrimidine deaminase/5-amino-6-(5-phosphoribosylamino)uracil reductase
MPGGRRSKVRNGGNPDASRRFLREALRLAAAGRTSPNPMVGAVLVCGSRIVGRGYHARAGEPHAEIVALAEAGRRARGARLYVNLEPCCHFGRTPPCTDAIVSAGVGEVIACMRDPDPRVNGRGFRALRAAGVKVRVGALASEARRLNAAFVRWARSGLPFVTLKAGMSLDGRIATRTGESKWITSPAARAEARALRGVHDAVLVGVNTVLADDPRLTAARRSGRGRTAERRCAPVRVVLDSTLRTPPGAKVLAAAGGETVILTRRDAPVRRRKRLERGGALVLDVPAKDGRLSLRRALAVLARRGIVSVLIEGGGEVLGSALDEKIGDRMVLYVAGVVIGGRQGRAAFGGRGVARLNDAMRLRGLTVRHIGSDLVVDGMPVFPGVRRR